MKRSKQSDNLGNSVLPDLSNCHLEGGLKWSDWQQTVYTREGQEEGI